MKINIYAKTITRNMPEQLNLSELVQVNFPENQYYREETQKTQIALHHTVSSGNVNGVVNWWLQGPCLLYTSPSPRDRTRSRMPSSA